MRSDDKPPPRRFVPFRRGSRKNHGHRTDAAGLADDALRRLVPDERLNIAKIQLAWSRTVPIRVQKVAWPDAIEGGTLRLNVIDNQWLHELNYLRFDLLGELRRACRDVEIKEVRMRVGDVQVLPPAERPPPPPKPPLGAEPARATIDAMEAVSDPTLRQAIANARLALGKP